MGPLFQLIFVIVIYAIAAAIAGFFLQLLFRFSLSVFGGDQKIATKAFWLPWKLAPYFFLALVANILFCEYVRGVDSLLTDSWSIQIGEKEALGTIDTMDNWRLWPSRDGGEAIVTNVSKFTLSEKAIFGEAKSGLFVYWLYPDSRLVMASKEEFTIQLAKAGLAEDALVSPNDYYYKNRWLGDLITFLIILAFPVYWFGNLVREAVNSVQKQKERGDASAI